MVNQGYSDLGLFQFLKVSGLNFTTDEVRFFEKKYGRLMLSFDTWYEILTSSYDCF